MLHCKLALAIVRWVFNHLPVWITPSYSHISPRIRIQSRVLFQLNRQPTTLKKFNTIENKETTDIFLFIFPDVSTTGIYCLSLIALEKMVVSFVLELLKLFWSISIPSTIPPSSLIPPSSINISLLLPQYFPNMQWCHTKLALKVTHHPDLEMYYSFISIWPKPGGK